MAGVLYPFIGLTGILIIDLVTFSIAIATLCFVQIPQSTQTSPSPSLPTPHSLLPRIHSLWQELTLGFRYLWKRPSLFALQLFSEGRVFSASSFLTSLTSPLGFLIVGS